MPLLVALLGPKHDWQNVPEKATDALASLAYGYQQSQDAIIAAGAVHLLVANLGSDQPKLRHAAANALEKLAAGSQQNRDMIITARAASVI